MPIIMHESDTRMAKVAPMQSAMSKVNTIVISRTMKMSSERCGDEAVEMKQSMACHVCAYRRASACASTSKAGACEGKLARACDACMRAEARDDHCRNAGNMSRQRRKRRAHLLRMNGVRRADARAGGGRGGGSERTPSGWRTCRHAEDDLNQGAESSAASP